ncbi:MAG: chromosome segregation ATPase [Cyanobacteria bacterium P01_H01_bin.15]
MNNESLSEETPPPASLADAETSPTESTVKPQAVSTAAPPPARRRRHPLRWVGSWTTITTVMILLCGGVAAGSTSWLLRLPKTPNCDNVLWLTASAAMRLYCAQLLAEERTTESLLSAIKLVEALPADHPLRSQINTEVEIWAGDILKVAEDIFQEGDIENAIATARQIPKDAETYQLVSDKIERWEKIWAQGEKIFTNLDASLREFEWNQAFDQAVRLTKVSNRYWATTKYEEGVARIQQARQDSKNFSEAQAQFKKTDLSSWLRAYEIVAAMGPDSYFHEKAQALISDIRSTLLSYGDSLVDERDWSRLLSLTNRAPRELDIKTELTGWRQIAQAGSNAQIGTTSSLENAIAAAKEIKSDSAVYPDAQALIQRWNREIEGVAHLEKANELARSGLIDDLEAAIAAARLVKSGNPAYSRAQKEIASWRAEIQTIEDQPILNKARSLASGGGSRALQEAIAQANLIRAGRALYPEAQRQIATWQSNLQLTQANLRNQARLKQREAERKQYESRLSARNSRRTTASTAPQGENRRTSTWGDSSSNASRNLGDSGQALLNQANSRAGTNVKDAITIAQQIPPGSPAYLEAQARIRQWEGQVKSTVTLPESVPAPAELAPEPLVIPETTPAAEPLAPSAAPDAPISTDIIELPSQEPEVPAAGVAPVETTPPPAAVTNPEPALTTPITPVPAEQPVESIAPSLTDQPSETADDG